MKDPEFLAEAQKLNLDVNPMSGQAIHDLLVETYATPKAIVERAAQAIAK